MTGSAAVLALVLIEWTAGWIGAAAWTQSWDVVKRGHFRITGYAVVVLAVASVFATNDAVPAGDGIRLAVYAMAALCLLYAGAQYLESNLVAQITGGLAALAGGVALVQAAASISGWPMMLAAVALLAGAVFVGAVTNGMMLGHWYLNQPGLKPWALGRLTQLAIGGVVASGILGLLAAGRLTAAATEGAVLGLPGFGDSFGVAFYGIWLALLVFSAVVVLAARRCIKIRSIQSATGLYYVAILTAGVAEFLVRYLMVNAVTDVIG